jgi:hypothetical protein
MYKFTVVVKIPEGVVKGFSNEKYPFRDSRRNFLFFSGKLTRIWDKIDV